ncbi:hypothetical protein Phi47:1_gp75 [Cellulophaga phage phi47:1]|nr:hypothetical protein Phi38:2_gp75 [Cellulophaga phage phi38:2]AGO49812.1 hypothetical protein Phi47:1_gp75 [Cellulophaga phage phi47:1]
MYSVINLDGDLNFSGKALVLDIQGALDLYDSLGGAAKCFKVVKVNTLNKNK